MRTEYIIGNGRAPLWCRALLSPYLKMDGSVGYEFRGVKMNFDLNVGDKLIMDERGMIRVIRGKNGR